MAKKNINMAIKPYLSSVLSKAGIRHGFGDGFVEADSISGSLLHRYICEAYCEKQRLTSQMPYLPVYHMDIFKNERALVKMLKDNGRMNFTVLDSSIDWLLRQPQAVPFNSDCIDRIYEHEIHENRQLIDEWLRSDVDYLGLAANASHNIAFLKESGIYHMYNSVWFLLDRYTDYRRCFPFRMGID